MMTRQAAPTLLVLGVLAALAGTSGEAVAVERRPWKDYEILIERNMFSRIRGRREVEARRIVNPQAPDPERFVWLRGVVRKDGEFVACLEDMRSNSTLRVRAGENVVRGKLSEVRMDAVVYVLDGREFEVGIGNNLEATTTAPPAGSSSAGAGSTSTTPAPTEGVGGLLERLRQQRLKELGQ